MCNFVNTLCTVKFIQHPIKYDSVQVKLLFCAVQCCLNEHMMLLSTLSFGSSAPVWSLCSESYYMVSVIDQWGRGGTSNHQQCPPYPITNRVTIPWFFIQIFGGFYNKHSVFMTICHGDFGHCYIDWSVGQRGDFEPPVVCTVQHMSNILNTNLWLQWVLGEFSIAIDSIYGSDIKRSSLQYLVVKVLCLRNYMAASSQLLLTGKSLRFECSGRTHSSHSQLIGLMRAIMAIMAICSQGKPGVTFGNILTTQSHLSQHKIVKLVQKHQGHDSIDI